MFGLDTGPGRALKHIANAELQLRVLSVADGHNEASRPTILLTLHKQVKPKVMVGAIVHHVTPDPGTALDRFDVALPADAGDGLL